MTSAKDTGEALLFALRGLYGSHGYSHYKMSKFEEYDLYAHNKDFLVSDSVITFTDGNGKLLALKPDVTLSIVKNTRDGGDGVQKLYYDENVYRMGKGSRNFKEIMQVGLECIGDVDAYSVFEVLSLALDSLAAIGGQTVLSVSHLGILAEVMDFAGIPAAQHAAVLACVGEKNTHELSALLASLGVAGEGAELLRCLIGVQGPAAALLPTLHNALAGAVRAETLAAFEAVLAPLSENPALYLDFSVVDDLHYYNEFVFKGFVEGIPASVLSGGQYDRLMRKMGRSSHAIGFAVYLDTVEQYLSHSAPFDVNAFLLYDEKCSLPEIGAAATALSASFGSVRAGAVIPAGLKYEKLFRMRNGKAEAVETDA